MSILLYFYIISLPHLSPCSSIVVLDSKDEDMKITSVFKNLERKILKCNSVSVVRNLESNGRESHEQEKNECKLAQKKKSTISWKLEKIKIFILVYLIYVNMCVFYIIL